MTDFNALSIGYPKDRVEMNHRGVKYHGAATVWRDMVSSLIGSRLNSAAGKVGYDYDENAIDFASGGDIAVTADRLAWSSEMPHEALIGDGVKIVPHLHLEQDTTNAIEFTLRYRIQNNGQAKTTDWTTLSADYTSDLVFPYTSGTLNQILTFGPVDMSAAALSDTLQFQMARTDATGGNVLVTFADFHVELDAPGSDQQFTK